MSNFRAQGTMHDGSIGFVEAAVCTPSGVTRYRTSGRGSPVYLVLAEDPAGVAVRRWARGLAGGRGGRTVIPELHGARAFGGAARTAWLRDFIDGLGLVPTFLVVDRAWEEAAREAARYEPERVAGILPLS